MPHWRKDVHTHLLQAIIVPNGVSGTVFTPPIGLEHLVAPNAQLTVVDCVFQMGTYQTGTPISTLTRNLLKTLDIDRTVLLFTPSKDLSIPGIRAGVLVSRNVDLMRFVRADRFERSFSTSPLISQIVLLYFFILLAREHQLGQSCGASYEQIIGIFDSYGLASVCPDQKSLDAILAHLDRMESRFRENLELSLSDRYPLSLPEQWRPCAGYSGFPQLTLEFANPSAYVSWIRATGVKHRLKLNPNYLFGGASTIWELLYPHQYRVRLNLSVEPDYLYKTLERLRSVSPPR